MNEIMKYKSSSAWREVYDRRQRWHGISMPTWVRADNFPLDGNRNDGHYIPMEQAKKYAGEKKRFKIKESARQARKHRKRLKRESPNWMVTK